MPTPHPDRHPDGPSYEATCGNDIGARTCRDPDCWCGYDEKAWSLLSSARYSWPRVGYDAYFDLVRRGYGDHDMVEVHLPD